MPAEQHDGSTARRKRSDDDVRRPDHSPVEGRERTADALSARASAGDLSGPVLPTALTPQQERQLHTLADLLREAPLNLLSRRDRERIWERHVGEALRIWDVVRPAPGDCWLDLGTGGGLPGLVLAVLSPEAAFTLLDAREKKIAAVEGFLAQLSLRNVRAVAGRAETIGRRPEHRGRYDGVVSRAVGRLTTVVELSRGFVRPGGQIVAVRGGGVAEELPQLHGVAHRLAVQDVEGLPLRGAARETWLVRMRAQGRPPGGIPRPNGVPAARPLGAGGV